MCMYRTCYSKFFLLHYRKILCQYRPCKVDHVYRTYLMPQRQLSELNCCKLDCHLVQDVNWFSKQSAIVLAFSFRCYVRSINSGWRLCSSLFINDLAIGHTAWGMNSEFPTLFPTVLVPFYRSFIWRFWRPNYLQFYMLVPGYLPQFP
jgi:hypothetical protein